jgi:predicted tellurium resistance membrane protein TerC
MIVKAKAAVFIIATIVLVLNVILLVVEKLNYLIFLGILFLIFVGANTAYRSIDRRRKSNPQQN